MRQKVPSVLKILSQCLKYIVFFQGRRRQQRFSFAIDHSRPIIGDAEDSRETARWIFFVLIGSEVCSIVTYFRKTQTMAIVNAAQAQ